MSRDLSSVVHKIERSGVHVREAQGIFKSFIDSNFCHTVIEPNGNGRYIVKIAAITTPDASLSLAIGDAAHCLRSAFDYLAFAFAKKVNGKEDRGVQFPICSTPKKFTDQRSGRLKNVHRSARALMERFQPYHRRKYREARWLSALREINDMDKHRLLAFTEVRVKRLKLIHDADIQIMKSRTYSGRMKVGAILARFESQSQLVHEKVKVNMVVIPVFGDDSPEEIRGETAINSIVAARNFAIDTVLPSFIRIA